MTRGMAIGDALPTEADHPIEDLDGNGLFAALAWLDLDASTWLAQGPAFGLRYTGSRFPEEKGPIFHIKSEHYKQQARPEDAWLSEITTVVRDGPQQLPRP
jgi:hypothetical protein